jgi:hypothetical protein
MANLGPRGSEVVEERVGQVLPNAEAWASHWLVLIVSDGCGGGNAARFRKSDA